VGVAALAWEGVSRDVLGILATSTTELLPNSIPINGLQVSSALRGTWDSSFMANFMDPQQGMMQQALISMDVGKKLMIYTTSLAAASTMKTTRGILCEHLATALGVDQVATVPANIYHTCIHSPTLSLLQQDIMSKFEMCSSLCRS